MTTAYKNATKAQSYAKRGVVRTGNQGVAFATNDFITLRRMVVLGTDRGSYYAAADSLTSEFINVVNRCLDENPTETINTIRDVSTQALTSSNEHALFALALAASYGLTKDTMQVDKRIGTQTRDAALAALPAIARTGTHLLHFVDYVSDLRGWGTALRRGIAAWYTTNAQGQPRSPMALAQQVTKYASRDDWSHADVLRLVHPQPQNAVIDGIFNYVVNERDISKLPVGQVQEYLLAVNMAKDENTSKESVISLISTYSLPREVVHTKWLNDPDVMLALLPHMGIHALLRNLGNLSKAGVLTNLSRAESDVLAKLVVPANGLLHPLDVLKAQRQYNRGRGNYGTATWQPSQSVSNRLEELFYESFKTITPTNKRLYVAIDVSGSMSWDSSLDGMSASETAAVMAMALIRVEPQVYVTGFASSIRPLGVTKHDSLATVMKKVEGHIGEGTYCSVPITHATENNMDVDTFILYTDSQTSDQKLVSDYLSDYRQKRSGEGKMVVNAMQSNNLSLADSSDPRQLNLVGVSSDTPKIIHAFVTGTF